MLTAIVSLLIAVSNAEFGLVQNLNKAQRIEVLKTLGMGTQSKNMFTPRPLGTDSGIELAIMTEIINTKEIKNLIRNSQAEDTLFYPKILIGKGLYNRADIFFHFIPYTATLGLSEFGGILRVHVYNSDASPFASSVIIHANSANFNNQLVSRNVGTDATMGFEWKHFALSTSLGWATSSGKFVGGSQGVTDSLFDENETINSFHIGVGGLFRYDAFNIALSFDHYEQPVYSIKFGLIF